MFLRLHNHTSVARDVTFGQYDKSLPHRSAESSFGGRPTQRGLAIDLVHILSARPTAAGKAPLQLLVGDLNLLVDSNTSHFVLNKSHSRWSCPPPLGLFNAIMPPIQSIMPTSSGTGSKMVACRSPGAAAPLICNQDTHYTQKVQNSIWIGAVPEMRQLTFKRRGPVALQSISS